MSIGNPMSDSLIIHWAYPLCLKQVVLIQRCPDLRNCCFFLIRFNSRVVDRELIHRYSIVYRILKTQSFSIIYYIIAITVEASKKLLCLS
jgi:hypothetical protein